MSNNDNWLALGCAILAIILALVGILLPESSSFPSNYPYANLTGIPQIFPYSNLTGVPSSFPYGNLTGVPNVDLMHGLVLWLPFDGVALDKCGYDNDAMVYGASWVGGKYGKALSFDGNNDYAEVPYNESLWGFTSFTVTLWMNPNVATGEHRGLINLKGASLSQYFSLQIWQSKWWCDLVTSTGGTSLYPNSPLPVAGKWAFLSMMWNGSTMRLCVDNIEVSSGARDGVLTSTGNILEIGIYNQVSQPYVGFIDDVRVYNRILSNIEGNALFTLGT